MTITIDDYIPVMEDGIVPFVGAGPDKSLWGSLIEKAVAKMNGGY